MARTAILLAALALGACSASDGDTGEPTLDTDGDGLTDAEEQELGTDPTLPDSDGDSWQDLEEVEAGTDPLDYWDKPYKAGWPLDAHCRDQVQPTNPAGGTYAVGDVVRTFESFTHMGEERLRLYDFCDHVVVLVSSGFG